MRTRFASVTCSTTPGRPVELAGRYGRSELDENRLLQLSLTRLVEIVGEAAAKLSNQHHGELAHIPWPEIINTRHRLIHAYDFVDYDILWQTIQEDSQFWSCQTQP